MNYIESAKRNLSIWATIPPNYFRKRRSVTTKLTSCWRLDSQMIRQGLRREIVIATITKKSVKLLHIVRQKITSVSYGWQGCQHIYKAVSSTLCMSLRSASTCQNWALDLLLSKTEHVFKPYVPGAYCSFIISSKTETFWNLIFIVPKRKFVAKKGSDHINTIAIFSRFYELFMINI